MENTARYFLAAAFFQRAFAALRAIAERSLAERLAARVKPPLLAPSLPRAIAALFLAARLAIDLSRTAALFLTDVVFPIPSTSVLLTRLSILTIEFTCFQPTMPFSLMSSAQIVHVEEVLLGKRTYTITVVRIAGGLAARWYCDCGAAVALPTA